LWSTDRPTWYPSDPVIAGEMLRKPRKTGRVILRKRTVKRLMTVCDSSGSVKINQKLFQLFFEHFVPYEAGYC
jgi:hypothetical protein